MAIVYAKIGLSTGTGAGTKADPYPLKDMFILNFLGVGDVLAVMTDGSTVETMAGNFSPNATSNLVCPVDVNGDPEPTFRRYLMDFSGGGNVTATDFGCVIVGAEARNCAAQAFYVPAADQVGFVGCKSLDPGTQGFQIANGAEICVMAGCISEGAGGGGFWILDGVEGSTIHNCVDIDSDTENSIRGVAVNGFLCIMDNNDTNSTGVAITGTTRMCVVSDVTVHMRGAGTGWKGISIAGEKQAIYDSLVVGNNASGSVAYALNSNEPLFRNNYYYNVETVVTGTPSGPNYAAPTLQDPDFVNAAGGDYTPQNAMIATMLPKILNEGQDWRDAGIIPKARGAGGGGGMLVHPGMSGGPRG